ncbi:MAG: hypothetical protein ACLU8W_10900 [Clostridia bacterium]
MRRKFSKLKALMFEQEISQEYIARQLGRGTTYVARRMNAHEPFTTEDMRIIGNLLDIPRSEWLDYFMEEGQA